MTSAVGQHSALIYLERFTPRLSEKLTVDDHVIGTETITTTLDAVYAKRSICRRLLKAETCRNRRDGCERGDPCKVAGLVACYWILILSLAENVYRRSARCATSLSPHSEAIAGLRLTMSKRKSVADDVHTAAVYVCSPLRAAHYQGKLCLAVLGEIPGSALLISTF